MMGTDIDLEDAFVSMLESVEFENDLLKVCKEAAERDESYQAAKIAYASDWPSGHKPLVGEYWSGRDELTVENEFLFFRGRLVIPKMARKDVLRFLHLGHVGMTAMVKRAETAAWWPAIKNDVKRFVDACGECQMSRPAQRREPMLSFEVPEAPGVVVHADYFEFGAHHYLILVDGFSGWTEIFAMSNMRPSELMRVMRLYMVRNGIPKTFHADQGSAFESAEFGEFCQKWGIRFSDNSPKYPRGNSIAEAHVKKAKHILSTAADDDELAKALLALMQTPVSVGGPSPAQLHLGRNVRDDLHPRVEKEERSWQQHKDWKEKKAMKAKEYYDRGTRALDELQSGEKVLVWHRERWQNGIVLRKLTRPRSYEIQLTETNQRLERNRAQIRRLVPDVLEPLPKRSHPFSFFQQRLPVQVLAPTAVPVTGEASTSGRDDHNDADRSRDTDQPENTNNDGEDSEEDERDEDGSSEEEYEDVEDHAPSPLRTPPATYRTRIGRSVRPPDKYSPS
jgi:hypothetical protein